MQRCYTCPHGFAKNWSLLKVEAKTSTAAFSSVKCLSSRMFKGLDLKYQKRQDLKRNQLDRFWDTLLSTTAVSPLAPGRSGGKRRPMRARLPPVSANESRGWIAFPHACHAPPHPLQGSWEGARIVSGEGDQGRKRGEVKGK